MRRLSLHATYWGCFVSSAFVYIEPALFVLQIPLVKILVVCVILCMADKLYQYIPDNFQVQRMRLKILRNCSLIAEHQELKTEVRLVLNVTGF